MAARYTPQQIKDQYEKLPETLKQAIYSADIADKMFAIGKKHALTMEKIGFMSEEAGLVVLGLTPPRAFAPALAERLAIPADMAEKMALEISHEIFFPLREALKQTHQIEVGEGAMIKNEELRIPEAEQARYGAGRSQESGQMKPESPAPAMPQPAPNIAEVKPTPQPVSRPSSLPTTEVKPPLMPPAPSRPETPKTPESPKTEISKKMPVALRAVADNMEKKIAPLIGGIRNGEPRGFLSLEETEKLVAEKQAGIRKQELGITDEQKTPAPIKLEPLTFAPPPPPSPPVPSAPEIKIPPPLSPAPMPPRPKNSIDLRTSAPPPPPPAIPINPKIPPIDLRAVPPKEPSETPPQPAREKTKPYQGYDPYREPIE